MGCTWVARPAAKTSSSTVTDLSKKTILSRWINFCTIKQVYPPSTDNDYCKKNKNKHCQTIVFSVIQKNPFLDVKYFLCKKKPTAQRVVLSNRTTLRCFFVKNAECIFFYTKHSFFSVQVFAVFIILIAVFF